MADFVCHYILLISGFQNFVTRVTKNPATVTGKIVAATVKQPIAIVKTNHGFLDRSGTTNSKHVLIKNCSTETSINQSPLRLSEKKQTLGRSRDSRPDSSVCQKCKRVRYRGPG